MPATPPSDSTTLPKPRLRLIPLDDTVVFPNMGITLTIDVGDDERVVLVPRHENEFLEVGTIAEVSEQIRLPGGGHAVALSGEHRALIGASQLTEAEFREAAAILAELGRQSTDTHNEVVLMAGSLGVSSLFCLLNNGDQGNTETAQSLLGPFWRLNSPRVENGGSIVRSETPGAALFVTARVVDHAGNPVAGAEVDVWHASPVGLYENQDPEQAEMNQRLQQYQEELLAAFPEMTRHDIVACDGDLQRLAELVAPKSGMEQTAALARLQEILHATPETATNPDTVASREAWPETTELVHGDPERRD